MHRCAGGGWEEGGEFLDGEGREGGQMEEMSTEVCRAGLSAEVRKAGAYEMKL